MPQKKFVILETHVYHGKHRVKHSEKKIQVHGNSSPITVISKLYCSKNLCTTAG